MNTVNVDLSAQEQLNLLLGRQLENEASEVVFDFSSLNTEFGSGTLSLSVLRPSDTTPYAVELTTSGTDATWSVSSTDTAYAGVGKIQLTYTVGDQVKKTLLYLFTIYPSLGADGEYPSPGQTWQEEIEADITELRQDLDDLPFIDVLTTSAMTDTTMIYRYDGALYFYNGSAWTEIGTGSASAVEIYASGTSLVINTNITDGNEVSY